MGRWRCYYQRQETWEVVELVLKNVLRRVQLLVSGEICTCSIGDLMGQDYNPGPSTQRGLSRTWKWLRSPRSSVSIKGRVENWGSTSMLGWEMEEAKINQGGKRVTKINPSQGSQGMLFHERGGDIKCCRETEEDEDPEGVVGTRELSVVT